MRVISVGTEIVECLRIGRMIERHGEAFLHRVYTAREIQFCQTRRRTLEHFAGRWAAKEAALKCLGTVWGRGIGWTDMEIRNDASGVPRLELTGAARDRAEELKISDILIAIGHCRAYATAQATAVGEDVF